ncbi:MAG: esterase/lipase [Microbacterium sp.]|jgi:acetyl esterase/lipase|nr:esterase/lipase [Microbacterium sp.]
MNLGYLITVLVVSVPTAFALGRFGLRTPLGKTAFWLGMLINEAPFYPFVFLVGSTVLAAVDGDLATPADVVLLTVACAAALGLVVLQIRTFSARRELATALTDSGLDEQAIRLTAQGAGARGVWRAARTILLPLARIPRGVRVRRNLSYGPHRLQRLDVYRHRTARPGAPVLVQLHAGGFRSGSKSNETRYLLGRLSRMGWVCVSADYRLRPEVGFPAHLSDVGAILAWVRRHAAEHGADPSRIVTLGTSAGGTLAVLAGLAPDAVRAAFAREHPQQAATPLPELQAAVGLYGYYDRGLGVDPVPIDRADGASPPILLVSAAHDTIAPVHPTDELAARLRAVSSAPAVHATLPWAQHSFDVLRSVRVEAIADTVEGFLEAALDVSRPETTAAT